MVSPGRFYEGFGFPPLESMQMGTPVIASNVSSIPEICGDAAYMVDPNNIEEIALAMKKMVNDDYLRDELINKGYSRIVGFTWENTAKKTLEIFEQVVGE